jgi:hypothetical protein
MAQATDTLATVTLNATVVASERHWTLSSTSGISPGVRLYVGQELAAVEQVDQPVSGVVVVRRGVDGTIATAHPSGSTLYVGRGDQFYQSDPMGTPPNPIRVYPYINAISGVLWGVTGDEAGPNTAARVWTAITSVPGVGPLGVRTITTTTPG